MPSPGDGRESVASASIRSCGTRDSLCVCRAQNICEERNNELLEVSEYSELKTTQFSNKKKTIKRFYYKNYETMFFFLFISFQNIIAM